MTDCHVILAQVSKIIYIFAACYVTTKNRYIYEETDYSGRSGICS